MAKCLADRQNIPKKEACSERTHLPAFKARAGVERKRRPRSLVACRSLKLTGVGGMGGKNRERLWGDQLRAARIQADHAAKQADDATRSADAAACGLWCERDRRFRRADAATSHDCLGDQWRFCR
jgi:hypothetical protein